ALRAAQDKWAQCLGEQLARLSIGVSRDPAGELEDRRRAEHSGVQEFKHAPQFAQVIFDRRSAQRQTMVALQQPRGLRRSRVGVLDRLRFVENDVIEPYVFKQNRVFAQRAVGGQDQIIIVEMLQAFFLPELACMIEYSQLGGEGRSLLLPVKDERLWNDGK